MNSDLIPLKKVKKMSGLGTTSIYKRIKEKTFPAQVKLGRLSRWVEGEILDWINSQARLRQEC